MAGKGPEHVTASSMKHALAQIQVYIATPNKTQNIYMLKNETEL